VLVKTIDIVEDSSRHLLATAKGGEIEREGGNHDSKELLQS
jgi:hypothetical protein